MSEVDLLYSKLFEKLQLSVQWCHWFEYHIYTMFVGSFKHDKQIKHGQS